MKPNHETQIRHELAIASRILTGWSQTEESTKKSEWWSKKAKALEHLVTAGLERGTPERVPNEIVKEEYRVALTVYQAINRQAKKKVASSRRRQRVEGRLLSVPISVDAFEADWDWYEYEDISSLPANLSPSERARRYVAFRLDISEHTVKKMCSKKARPPHPTSSQMLLASVYTDLCCLVTSPECPLATLLEKASASLIQSSYGLFRMMYRSWVGRSNTRVSFAESPVPNIDLVSELCRHVVLEAENRPPA